MKAKSGLTFLYRPARARRVLVVRPAARSLTDRYSQILAETELTRQIVADDLANHDGFRFFTTRVMSPDGINAAYFPWSLERDWLGGVLTIALAAMIAASGCDRAEEACWVQPSDVSD